MDHGVVPIIDDVQISNYDENKRFKIDTKGASFWLAASMKNLLDHMKNKSLPLNNTNHWDGTFKL